MGAPELAPAGSEGPQCPLPSGGCGSVRSSSLRKLVLKRASLSFVTKGARSPPRSVLQYMDPSNKYGALRKGTLTTPYRSLHNVR